MRHPTPGLLRQRAVIPLAYAAPESTHPQTVCGLESREPSSGNSALPVSHQRATHGEDMPAVCWVRVFGAVRGTLFGLTLPP